MAGTGYTKELFIKDKPADVDLINDAVLNDDVDLVYPIAADEDIHFEIWAFYTAGAGGIQVAMSGPAGFTHLHYSANLDISGATKVTSAVATAWDVTVVKAAGSSGMVRIIGHVHNGINAGSLVFRWAQNASNPADTTVHQGSTIKVIRY